MNAIKRVLSLGLCALMFVTMLVFPVNAASETDSATLGAHQVNVSLYLDQMILSSYTKFAGLADYMDVQVALWRKNASTGAVSKCLDRIDRGEDTTSVSVSGTSDYGYVHFCADSTHSVTAENQTWSCSLGRLYAT